MNILEIPFVKTVRLTRSADGLLQLQMAPEVSNHLNTLHAGAQFTLTESAAGQLLIESFPELVGKMVPLLRESQIKFKRPANTAVTAFASITAEASQSLLDQIQRRGRGSIEVQVDVKDSAAKITCSASFNWYIQKIT